MKNRYLTIFLTVLLMLFGALARATHQTSVRHFPPGTQDVTVTPMPGVRMDLLPRITTIIESSIAKGNYPGAIVLVGHKNRIIYQGVFGNRRIVPDQAPMRFDTLFDVASLTKVMATTPAIMQLVEQGKLDLDVPVAHYWPAFAARGKGDITIRELLTHTSGLPADIPLPNNESDALIKIIHLKPVKKTGSEFLYSDVNFMVLAHLVEIISHERIDRYAQKHIFSLLNMHDTYYLPPKSLRDRIAPTNIEHHKLHWGDVQDPLASAMGGVSGNAGLFSTAHDLNLYAEALLNGGILPRTLQTQPKNKLHFLGPLSIQKMTTPQTPATITDTRGLGWDIDSQYSNRGVLFPLKSFGHSGWTGTSLWIDPVTKTWIIILTSRTHPAPANDNLLIEDRRIIANIVSASIIDISVYSFNNTGKGELNRAY